MKKILFLFAIFLFTPILYGMPVNAECSSSTNTGVPCWDPDTGDWLCYSSETCISGYCYETSYAAPGTSCNDGRSCTTGETCDGSGNCGGGTVSCYSPPGVCYSSSGSCDVNGNCAYPYASSGTPCGTSTCPADYCSGTYYYDYQPSCTRYCDGFGGCTDCCTPSIANCGITLSATCISSTTLRTYSSGTCGASGCNYPYTDTTCTYGCSGGSCNPPPAAVCGNGIVESGESCEDAQTYTSTTTSCGSGTCAGTQSYVYNCVSSTCQWNAGAWTACSSQGNVCSTGSCTLSSGTCGTGSQTVTRCDSSGGCTSSSSQSCTVGCSSGYTCSGGTCVSTGDTTPPTSSITSPAAGSTFSSSFSVSVTDSDTGGSGLASCDYYVYDSTAGYTVPSGTLRTCNSAFTVTVGSAGNCRTAGTGTCIVGVSSRDNAGNQMSPYNTRTFSISLADTTLPSVGTTSPTTAAVGTSTTFSASVSDNVAVTSCSLYVDGSNTGFMSLSTSPCISCTASKSYTFASAGSYSMYASCSDASGNREQGTSVTVGVTTPFPTPTCTATQPSQSFQLGNGCSVTVYSLGRDNSAGDPDGGAGRYSNTAIGSSFITTDFDDALSGDCDMDLQFQNSWSIYTNWFNMRSEKLAKSAANPLSYGYTATSSNCRFLALYTGCIEACPVCNTANDISLCGIGGSSITLLQKDSIASSEWGYEVGECVEDLDCVALKGSGWTCNTLTNMCKLTEGLPPTPTLLSPVNGATEVSIQPILDWTSVPGASNYRYYVRTLSQSKDNPTDNLCSSATESNAVGLSLGTTYYWSANACVDTCTCENYAPEWSFTTTSTPPVDITPPTVSILPTPLNPIYTDTVRYDASAYDELGGSGVTTTTIYIDEDGNAANGYEFQYSCSSPTCSVTRGPYPALRTVSYYALAWDAANNQGQSTIGNFIVGECNVNDRADGTSISCFNKIGYPNQYLKCGVPPVRDPATFACVEAPCSENSECDSGYCCDKSSQLPANLRGTGQCAPTPGNPSTRVRQPYICTS